MYFSASLSARIFPELRVRCLPIFCCMLPTVVARSFSGEGGEVCYLRLPCWHLFLSFFVFSRPTGSNFIEIFAAEFGTYDQLTGWLCSRRWWSWIFRETTSASESARRRLSEWANAFWRSTWNGPTSPACREKSSEVSRRCGTCRWPRTIFTDFRPPSLTTFAVSSDWS